MRVGIPRTHERSGPGSLYVLVPLSLSGGLLDVPCVWGGTVSLAVPLSQAGALFWVSACCLGKFFVCWEHGCLWKEVLRIRRFTVHNERNIKIASLKNNVFFFLCDYRTKQLWDGLWCQPLCQDPSSHWPWATHLTISKLLSLGPLEALDKCVIFKI